MVNDFIFELGCEELPSGAVWPLANELAKNFILELEKAQLAFGEIRCFATPRRLAIVVNDLETQQANQNITRKGPAVVAAFDANGTPTPALQGFAKSCAVSVDQLSKLKTDKGEWMVYEVEQKGESTKKLVPGLVQSALTNLAIAKPMRWGSGDEEFARPIHWTLLLFGDEVIHARILGVETGCSSRGHRFHHPKELIIKSAKSYESQLEEAFVVVDFSKRRALIKDQINKLADSYNAKAVVPDALLDEVTSIVEWPHALIAHFEKEFLEVPSEALIASMQAHQKCFALKDEQGALLPHFITVSNIESLNPNQVRLGNEKVMRARLSDAAFFFKQDKNHSLTTYIEGTKRIVFQDKLGSVYEKAQRVKQLSLYLSEFLGVAPQNTMRAAELSKCDLLTGMVGEFPELQGLMGYYYALHDKESVEVANALNEQYMPRFAADGLPESTLGKILSLADRIDTLVGIFAIGQKPSGVKDPFKLRRHALAVVRILNSLPVALNLSDLIHQSTQIYGAVLPSEKASLQELKPFILDRLNSYYQSQNYRIDLIQAVRARQDEQLYDLQDRLNALNTFITLPEAASLSAACKRVSNILHNAATEDSQLNVKQELLSESAEKILYTHIEQMEQTAEELIKEACYTDLLKHLASIKEPVDNFFDQVMVLVDDLSIKNNRLALLRRLQNLLQGVADISLLQ